MLRFLLVGSFPCGSIHIQRSPGSRLVVPEVEKVIDNAWQRARQQPGVRLFDGPMCRMESWTVIDDQLHLVLSQTSYRPFFGTNLSNPGIADRYGANVLANPVGVSTALVTADNRLMFGRRNSTLAYYPNRIHPFAGALEPRDELDVFAGVRRELEEEIALKPDDITEIRCTGMVEDTQLRQPELIFAARTRLALAEIEKNVDAAEHLGTWSIPALRQAVAAAMRDVSELTPVAIGVMLLWGRIDFGQAWFEKTARSLDIGS